MAVHMQTCEALTVVLLMSIHSSWCQVTEAVAPRAARLAAQATATCTLKTAQRLCLVTDIFTWRRWWALIDRPIQSTCPMSSAVHRWWEDVPTFDVKPRLHISVVFCGSPMPFSNFYTGLNSSWLIFVRPAPPGRGLRRGGNFWIRRTTASAQCFRRLWAFCSLEAH